MPNDDDVLRLIRDIYDAAIEPQRWLGAIDCIGEAIRAATPGIGIYDFQTGAFSLVAPRTDPEWTRRYSEYWASRNVLWQRSAQMPVGALVRFETFMPRDVFDRSEIYNEFFRPQEMDHALTGNILAEGAASGVISFFRPREDCEFGPEEERLLSALLPHLHRAMQLQVRLARLEMRRDSSAAMLDRFAHGALLVDAQSRVLFANRAAEAMLRGRGLHVERGQLAAERTAETVRLRQLIGEAAKAGSGGSLAVGREEQMPLLVVVVPLKTETNWLVSERSCAIVFIKDPQDHPATLSLSLFAQHFGLTPAQAAVSREIAAGDGVAAAASRLGISYATARTHLLQIFQKTGTTRQAELVHLMLAWNDGPSLS
jgi:DNA-binding CsgD family transcriptional regulator/PAS domain-containing protein